ncbi:MAG: hypothetical protein FP815_09100 [Desulfobulbaceae bacterium]|nr:hypothetical protein [Desulfobulbaceae bacterium]
MTRPTLQRPCKLESVVELQDLLNRTGALLIDDGDFGKETESAVKEAQAMAGLPATGIATPEIWAWLETHPLPSPDLSTRDVTSIVREEVSNRKRYNQVTTFPHFPGEQSGVTIGIGYDLRFQKPTNFAADWKEELPSEEFEKLQRYLGKKGCSEDVAELHSIKVPFTAAWRVFTRATLPRYINLTVSAFSQFNELPDGCRGALVSLVYNRGTEMSGDRRREIKAIRDHLAAHDFAKVATDLESMKRLWPNSRGLRDRRDREAALWRKGLKNAGLA